MNKVRITLVRIFFGGTLLIPVTLSSVVFESVQNQQDVAEVIDSAQPKGDDARDQGSDLGEVTSIEGACWVCWSRGLTAAVKNSHRVCLTYLLAELRGETTNPPLTWGKKWPYRWADDISDDSSDGCPDDSSALRYAVMWNEAACVRALVSKGSGFIWSDSVNKREQETALHVAVGWSLCDDNAEVIEALLGEDSSFTAVDAVDSRGRTALHVATEAGNLAAIRALRRSSGFTRPCAVDKIGCTALHYAFSYGHRIDGGRPISACRVREFLRSDELYPQGWLGDVVNARDHGGSTALHWAAQNSSADGITELLKPEYGFSAVYARDNEGYTAMQRAVIDKEMHPVVTEVQLALLGGEEVYEEICMAPTRTIAALLFATREEEQVGEDGVSRIVNVPLIRIADSARSGRVTEPACQPPPQESDVLFRVLFGCVDPQQETALHKVAREGRGKYMRLFLDMAQGSDEPSLVNAYNAAGQTPLHIAILAGAVAEFATDWDKPVAALLATRIERQEDDEGVEHDVLVKATDVDPNLGILKRSKPLEFLSASSSGRPEMCSEGDIWVIDDGFWSMRFCIQ